MRDCEKEESTVYAANRRVRKGTGTPLRVLRPFFSTGAATTGGFPFSAFVLAANLPHLGSPIQLVSTASY